MAFVDRDAHILAVTPSIFFPLSTPMQSSGPMHGTIHTLSFREKVKGVRRYVLFGMIQNGPRGLHILDEDVDDIQGYGIDWEDYRR